jgi:predicted metal-dependent hydrolase
VRFGKTKIHYDVIRRVSRRQTEIVITEKRLVQVLAPADKSDEEIHKIVKSNSRWIYRKQLHIQEKQMNSKSLTYSDGSKLPYLGKEYKLELVRVGQAMQDAKYKETFMFQTGRFIARTSDLSHFKIKSLYENWLQKQATRLLKKKVLYYCKIIGLDHTGLKIRIKSQRNRVGSLGRNLVLNFNKNLFRLPVKIIDYVVVHELCHVHVPNHSSKYWQHVGAIIPDYKRRKEWLEINKQEIIS